MRTALLLAAFLPLTALAQSATEALTPVLVTFGAATDHGQEFGTLTSKFPWRGTGSYTWNRVDASGTALKDGAGRDASVTYASNGTLCGGGGVLAAGDFPGRNEDFPQGVATGDWNGGCLNLQTTEANPLTLTLRGLDPRGRYTLTVLAARKNAWVDGTTTYTVSNATAVSAASKDGAPTISGTSVSQDTNSGNWVVMTFAFTAPDGTATLTCRGGAGNLNAFALEGTAAPRWQWANPNGGAWSEETNWDNAGATEEPWLRDLPDADGAVEIDYDADPEPAAIRYDAGSTAYVLKADTFGAAFVDGEVVKDGPGTVTLTSQATTADFYVAEGTLRVDGAAGLVTVAPGAALAGTGRVGALALADGAVLDAAAGALEVGALSLLQPTLLDKSLPEGETLAASATVTVRVPEGRGDGPVLAWEGALPKGLAFAVEDTAGNDLSAYVERGEGSLGLKGTAQVEAGLAGAARSAVLAAAIGARLKGEVGLAGVDAAAANEVFGCFEGEGLCVADTAANAVAVGYAFGIAEVRLEGAEAVVTVRVGDRAGGAGPTFVEGAAVRLTRGGETLASAEAPAGAAEVTLRVEASALGGGVAAEAFAPDAAAGE